MAIKAIGVEENIQDALRLLRAFQHDIRLLELCKQRLVLMLLRISSSERVDSAPDHREIGGTIVDATIVSAPSSTKNEAQARDPEMHQTKKNKQWYFGMKVHVGTSKQGLVHSV